MYGPACTCDEDGYWLDLLHVSAAFDAEQTILHRTVTLSSEWRFWEAIRLAWNVAVRALEDDARDAGLNWERRSELRTWVEPNVYHAHLEEDE